MFSDTLLGMSTTKICSRCSVEKPLGGFHRHPTASLGRKHHCKDCCRIIQRGLYERKLSRMGKRRTLRKGGSVDVCPYKRGDVREDGCIFFCKRNLKDGRFREWWVTKEQFELLNEKAKTKARYRYYNDPIYREKERMHNRSEESKARKRAWNRRNRDYLDSYFGARRAKTNVSNLSPEDRKKAREFYKFRDILNKVHGKTMFHVDHIVPIAVGGKHEPANLQITTAEYNVRKFKNPDPVRQAQKAKGY